VSEWSIPIEDDERPFFLLEDGGGACLNSLSGDSLKADLNGRELVLASRNDGARVED
jgi:hypothetical protein